VTVTVPVTVPVTVTVTPREGDDMSDEQKKDEQIAGVFIVIGIILVLIIAVGVYRTFHPVPSAEITYMNGQRVVVIKGHRTYDGPATYLYYMAGKPDPVLSITDPIPDEQRRCNVWFIIDLEGNTYKTTSFTWRRIN